jgi:hypothetical protein
MTDDPTEEDTPVGKPPIVIPCKGHVVVAVLCVVTAIALAASGGGVAIAVAIGLVVLAVVDVVSALKKRQIVER